MSLIFFDFEVFKNLWTVVFIDPIHREEKVIVNDSDALKNYYNQHKDEIFVGYNCRAYDQWIFKAILCGFNPKEVNDWIIVQKRKGWEFSDLLRNVTINNYDVFTGYNGLKTLEAFMGNDIRETTIPFDYEGEFTPAMIDEIIRYNRHDVEQTIEVFLRRQAMFDSHIALLKTFNLNARHISKTQAQLAAVILGAKPVTTKDEWSIRLPDTLRLGKYQHIADWFINPTSHDTSQSLTVDVAGVEHTFAWGGVHGAIPKFNYVCKPDEVLIMADVNQLYPSLMVEYGLLSRAVHEPQRFTNVLDTSLRLKAEGKKREREPYKLICNITYGTMGDKYNPMYDPLHRNLVCVFGQVLLLDLVEKIEPVCKLIQSNTDGILVLVKRKDVDTLKSIVSEWEDRTRLKMAYDEYEKVYQGDVNNYVVVDYKGKYKSKGAYVKSLNPLDNDLPIVNRAITDYLVNGIHPRDTIMASDKLIDFQKVVKVSSKYAYAVKVDSHLEKHPYGQCKHFHSNEYDGYCWKYKKHGRDVTCKNCPHYEVEMVTITDNETRLNDRTFRVFASSRPTDGMLKKVKTDGVKSEKFANTPEKCFIWNESVTDVPIPDYLDRDWYLNLAIERIRDKFNIEVRR